MRCCIGLFSVRGKEFNLYVRSFCVKIRIAADAASNVKMV